MSVYNEYSKKIKYDLNDDPIKPLHPFLKVLKWAGYFVLFLVACVIAVRIFLNGDSASAKAVYLSGRVYADYQISRADYVIYRIKTGENMASIPNPDDPNGMRTIAYKCDYIYYIPAAGQLEATVKYRSGAVSPTNPYPYNIYLIRAGGLKIKADLIAADIHYGFYELKYSFSGVMFYAYPTVMGDYSIEICLPSADGNESVIALYSLHQNAVSVEYFRGSDVREYSGLIK